MKKQLLILPLLAIMTLMSCGGDNTYSDGYNSHNPNQSSSEVITEEATSEIHISEDERKAINIAKACYEDYINNQYQYVTRQKTFEGLNEKVINKYDLTDYRSYLFHDAYGDKIHTLKYIKDNEVVEIDLLEKTITHKAGEKAINEYKEIFMDHINYYPGLKINTLIQCLNGFIYKRDDIIRREFDIPTYIDMSYEYNIAINSKTSMNLDFVIKAGEKEKVGNIVISNYKVMVASINYASDYHIETDRFSYDIPTFEEFDTTNFKHIHEKVE